MNRMRKVFCFLMATIFAAFALPATAADKLFTLGASTFTGSGTSIGNVIPAGTTVVLLLDFANQSPNGANSVMKTIQVLVPTDVSWKIIQTNSVNTTPNQTTVSCPTAPTYTGAAPTSTGTISLSNLTGVKPSGHFCLYLAVTSNLNACTPEIWQGSASTGSGGQAFFDFTTQTQPYSNATTIDGCTGILGCSTGNNTGGSYGSLVLTQSGFEGQADWGIVRGPNSNGGTCTLVPYQFNFNTTTKTASFIAGNKGAQDISAEYVVLFNPIPYPGYTVPGTVGFWPNYRPNLAWSNTFYGGNGVFAVSNTTTPKLPLPSLDYVPALACLDDDVAGTNVLPTIPDDSATSGPFSSAYAAGNTQYQPGKLALICVANMGWTSLTLTSPNSFGLPAGAYLQPWFKIIDRADGWVGLP